MNLLENERIEAGEHCNIIRGNSYSIMIYVEGYKKHAQVRGVYENNTSRVELLHRRGVEAAVRELVTHRYVYFRKPKDYFKIIRSRVDNKELTEKYPDLSDRIVA